MNIKVTTFSYCLSKSIIRTKFTKVYIFYRYTYFTKSFNYKVHHLFLCIIFNYLKFTIRFFKFLNNLQVKMQNAIFETWLLIFKNIASFYCLTILQNSIWRLFVCLVLSHLFLRIYIFVKIYINVFMFRVFNLKHWVFILLKLNDICARHFSKQK